EDGIRDRNVTGVQTCALPISALPAEAEVCRETMTCQRAPLREEAREKLDALRLETGWIDIAQQKASLFIHTSNPSLFAPAEQIRSEERRVGKEWRSQTTEQHD